MPQKAPAVVKRPASVRDIVEIANDLAEHANLATAHRFTAAVESTLNRLARMPGTGSLWNSEHPQLADVRCAPVTKFRNHLVFYRSIERGIEVLRVLHAARDIEGLFSAAVN